MEKKLFKPGEIIHEAGQPLDSLMLILDGTVNAVYDGGEYELKKGGVIGLSGLHSNCHLLTTHAVTQITVADYPCKTSSDLMNLIKTNPDTKRYFAASIFHLIH
jgi:signal-transduction protein with cAMP-binding, CBS, and nucleotidyltransferase domain